MPPRRRSQSESVYGRMRADLLRGRIRPGARVTESWAASQYGVSRTPVREACRRLAQEGLLLHRPRHGYRAPLIDATEVSELYDVRRALEALSVRNAAKSVARREVVGELLSTWNGDLLEDGEEAVFRDETFHITIAMIAGNATLVSMLEGINARIRLVRVHDFLDERRLAVTQRQHLAILRALARGDEGLVARRMDAHIVESQKSVSSAAARAMAELWAGAVRSLS